MSIARKDLSIGYERVRKKLRAAGGSKAVVLPKAWLSRFGAEDEVELVESSEGILILPVTRERSIEDEPEFGRFLEFLAKDVVSNPEKLGDMADLMEGDEDLYRDVETD